MNTLHAADFVLETLLNPEGHTGSAWAPPLLDNGTIQTTDQTENTDTTNRTDQSPPNYLQSNIGIWKTQ